MNQPVASFQIGKNGVTPGVIDSLKLVLKNHRSVRISVLKSSGRDRDKLKAMSEELEKHLSVKSRTIGFTIILRRHLSDKKQKHL